MLMLRLQRVGKIKSPSYRLVVSEKAKDTQSGSLEILGQYDPTKNPKVVNFKKDRVEYWLSVGAQTSNTVNNLLVNAGILSGAKKKSVYLSKARKTKLEAAKAEQAKAAEAAKPVEPAPAIEQPVAAESPAPAELSSVPEQAPTPPEQPAAEAEVKE